MIKYTFYNQIFKHFYRTSPKAHLQLSSSLKEIIVGNILGDLSV